MSPFPHRLRGAVAPLIAAALIFTASLAQAQAPTMVSAINTTATELVVTFSQDIDSVTGETTGNYLVFETLNPGNRLTATSAIVAGPTVTLTLNGSMVSGTGYTLRVQNVENTTGTPITPGSTIAFTATGPDLTPPEVTMASALVDDTVVVTFDEPVTVATAEIAGNYTVFPTATPGSPITVSSVSLSGDQVRATLTLASPLAGNVEHTVRVAAVEDEAGNPIATGVGDEATFTFVVVSITTIRDIQENFSTYDGTSVTIEGVVYIATNYRQPDTSVFSGYIQDDSGRGINVFGFSDSPFVGDAALTTLGNLVRMTGTITSNFTTVEIVDLTSLQVLATGEPRPNPVQLTTGAASDPQWEGTFIEVTGELISTSTGGPGQNLTVDDGSGTVVVRVVDTLGATIPPTGSTITARGAGGQFQDDFQVNVGLASDLFEGTSTDQTPPSLQRVSLESDQALVVDFSEAVEETSALDPANYEVFRTSTPTETIDVISASPVSETRIRLNLASVLNLELGYTLRVSNVEDLAGNAISAGGITLEVQILPNEQVSLNGPPFTFLPREGETYPFRVNIPAAVIESGQVLLRIFDLQGVLVATPLDSRFPFRGTQLSENEFLIPWDGRDSFREIVPPGAYVAHLQVRGPVEGGTKETHMPVVVASRLQR